jgi:hypothetical protein
MMLVPHAITFAILEFVYRPMTFAINQINMKPTRTGAAHQPQALLQHPHAGEP